MTSKENKEELHTRLVVEDRARQLALAKSESDVLSLIRTSISQLEIAADRLEHILRLPGEGQDNAG